jgi:prepilin-type processing-associated H-X9-DG protein
MATFVFTTESVDQAGVRLVLIFSPHGNRMNVSLQDGPEEKEA